MPEEEKKPGVARAFKDFFGYRPGDKLADFYDEIKDLSEEEKTQLFKGINDESMTY